MSEVSRHAKTMATSGRFIEDRGHKRVPFNVTDESVSGVTWYLVSVGDVDVPSKFPYNPALLVTSPEVVEALKGVLMKSPSFKGSLIEAIGREEGEVEECWNGDLKFCDCPVAEACSSNDFETIHFHVVGTRACLHCCVSDPSNVFVTVHVPVRNKGGDEKR